LLRENREVLRVKKNGVGVGGEKKKGGIVRLRA